MVMAPDASEIMGVVADTTGIQDMAAGDYKRAVHEAMPRDYVRMYHPDGTTSIVQLPPLGKNGKGIGERQRRIMHYILNKKVRGKQWWYAAPPEGWQPKTPRYSCFLVGCDRNREPNLHTLFDLFQHFNHKHPDETKMYEGVLKAIQQKLSQEIPPELAQQLGLDVGTKTLNSEQFEHVMQGKTLAPAAEIDELLSPDATAARYEAMKKVMQQQSIAELLAPDAAEELQAPINEPVVVTSMTVGLYDCADCDWKPKPMAKNPLVALRAHRMHKHKKEAPV